MNTLVFETTQRIGLISRVKLMTRLFLLSVFKKKLVDVKETCKLEVETVDQDDDAKKIKSCDLGTKIGSGSYGAFYTLKSNDRFGVKIMPSSNKYEAMLELSNLRKAYDKCPDLFPKPGVLVRFGEYYGYSMEYIHMKTLRDVSIAYGINAQIIIDQLLNVMLEDKIRHHDLHRNNVLYDPNSGNFKVIDADPNFLNVG